jgi:hypothetical protein
MKTKLYISLCFATLSWFTPFPFPLLVTCNICHQMSNILDMTWFSDKTGFHLLGFVNRQNMCIWFDKILALLPQFPHPQKMEDTMHVHICESVGCQTRFSVIFKKMGQCVGYLISPWIGFRARIISKGFWPPQSLGMTSSCGVC